MTDETVKRDALGIPYKPRPLPPQPAKSLLNGLHKYRPKTDLAATFRRVRREMAGAARTEYIPAPKPAQLLTFSGCSFRNSTRKVG